ncbi:MAG: aquaporin family protein [Gammaproteobacteria bacterium]|nr:aquaporin family protein [Gammaproteobacteria bacterium]MYD75255.1 aquaporin family protein [Gammaproteobacteria bacterium]MYJ52727.1 aquaporin family protein [Gammaproteobacteria bacterium]
MYSTAQRYSAEFIGTAFLLATVVGSGIMAENLSQGNTALALLGNTIPTGAILVVLITMFGPVSGAHFNPAVTLVFFLRKELSALDSAAYVALQVAGGLAGAAAAHIMFEMEVIQASTNHRTGSAQWFSEWVAAFGLVLTILMVLQVRKGAVAMAVGLYITAAYWFTASTSFANPAVTIARSFTDTFSGIFPTHAPAFIAAQLAGALCALGTCTMLLPKKDSQNRESVSS